MEGVKDGRSERWKEIMSSDVGDNTFDDPHKTIP